MNQPLRLLSFFSILATLLLSASSSLQAADKTKIVLIAGATKKVDRPGHHDYLAGCRLLQNLLQQTPGIEAVLVKEDWPADEAVFDGAKSIVFYTDGGGKQAYLSTSKRIAAIQKLVDAGIGIVSIHQAVEFPPKLEKQSLAWTGAVYKKPKAGRGHWDSKHDQFPNHQVASGVKAWEINDGWLNGFTFAKKTKGITPLVWSGKEHVGSQKGGVKDVVAWTFDRPNGGRSFNFSGLDAHSAFENAGMTQLMVNGILWTAGQPVPKDGFKFEADKALINSFLTPRTSPKSKKK
ncbi:MAG: ThuA domain-containing protein [Verrucomicrobia bacterium]|nr:ThuA domain-containing protein [Verrucomicrobiota bacterium]